MDNIYASIPMLLAYETGWALIFSLVASWIVCKVLDMKPIERVILPSRDLREQADALLEQKEVGKWTANDINIFRGLCDVDRARLLMVAIIYAITAFCISPLV